VIPIGQVRERWWYQRSIVAQK